MALVVSTSLEQRPMTTLAQFNVEESIQELYHPPLSSNEIRLVILHSSEEGTEINCTLRTVRLESRPIFEAISWLWGAIARTTSISLNGRTWHVPENLHNALICLRRAERSRTLWVDALSINQGVYEAALIERAKQIRLMRYIYSFASHVIIWMGLPSTDLSETSLAKLHTGEWIKDLMIYTSPAGNVVNEIINNQWWTRTWILQESSLPEISSIQFGAVSTSFRHSISGLNEIPHWYRPTKDFRATKARVRNYCELYQKMMDLAESQMRQLPGYLSSSHLPDDVHNSLRVFIDILQDCRNQDVTDPRDKI